MYVGLDVHKKYIDATAVDENGRVVKTGKFKYCRNGFEDFFRGIDDAKVSIEASSCWEPAYRLLEEMGYGVKLAHPLKTRLIADARIKTDSRDSEALARLLSMDWLPTSYVPPRDIQELRRLVRLRVYLVRERTRFKNKVHAALFREGFEGKGDVFAKKRRGPIEELDIEEVSRCLSIIDLLEMHIRDLSAEIKRIAGESREAKWLMSVPGIGYFSAIVILAEIGDVSRFENDEKLCSYAGLVPSTHQSGNLLLHGKITRQGSSILRWVLEECVWTHLQYAKDTSLTRFFYRLAQRKGKQKAAVATARKLLKVVYALLREREFQDCAPKGRGCLEHTSAALAASNRLRPLGRIAVMRHRPRIRRMPNLPLDQKKKRRWNKMG